MSQQLPNKVSCPSTSFFFFFFFPPAFLQRFVGSTSRCAASQPGNAAHLDPNHNSDRAEGPRPTPPCRAGPRSWFCQYQYKRNQSK
jgi:hypothetical protein